MPDRVYFGNFSVDLQSGEIQNLGVKVKLRGKPCQILIALLKNPGEVVPRKQLIELLWAPNTFVDFDANIKTSLSHLRRALGDSVASPRYIQTVHGVGYRFLEPVHTTDPRASQDLAPQPSNLIEDSPQDAAAVPNFAMNLPDFQSQSYQGTGWARVTAVVTTLLVAVLLVAFVVRSKPTVLQSQSHINDKHSREVLLIPFENTNGDTANQSLVSGVFNGVASSLQVRLPDSITVVRQEQRGNVPATGQPAGQNSGVEYILEGNMNCSHDFVTLNAELLRVADGKIVWSGTLEHKRTEAMSFQNEIADRVSESIVRQNGPSGSADGGDRGAL